MPESKTLKCISAAHVDGKIVKVGVVADYKEPLASRLLISNRFKVVTGSESTGPDSPSTVAELKAALDERGIEYPDDAKKADLQALFQEAASE